MYLRGMSMHTAMGEASRVYSISLKEHSERNILETYSGTRAPCPLGRLGTLQVREDDTHTERERGRETDTHIALAIPASSHWRRTTPDSDHATVTRRCAISPTVSAVMTIIR